MRGALNILRRITATLLFGFGVVIIVGFVWVMVEGGDETPMWQHLLCVAFMGVLPVVGALLLFFIKRPSSSSATISEK